MFCISCGSQLTENAKFCIHCGAKVNVTTENQDIQSKGTDTEDYQRFHEHFKKNKPFYLLVEDVFDITGRGPVVTGIVQSKCVSMGEQVTIFDTDGHIIARHVTVTGIVYCRKLLDVATPKMSVGLLLKIGKGIVMMGNVLVGENC